MNRNVFKDIVEVMLLGTAVFTWLSGMIYWIQSGNNDLWFSRTALSIVCLGMWYIGEKAGSQKSEEE